MSSIREFSPEVVRELGHYVYLYLDPRDSEVFYVGKGRGNRAFTHLEDTSGADKVERIREVREAGHEPVIELLVHGLETSEEAYRVEAAVIDLLDTDQLTNAVRGWKSGTYGRMAAEQVEAQYGADAVEIEEPALLIRINRLFRYGMSPQELYDATRGWWVVGERRERVEIGLAVYDGVVQEVYRIEGWYPAGSTFNTRDDEPPEDRWEFVGRVAGDELREKYRFGSVRDYWKQGAQNPIRYVNVD